MTFSHAYTEDNDDNLKVFDSLTSEKGLWNIKSEPYTPREKDELSTHAHMDTPPISSEITTRRTDWKKAKNKYQKLIAIKSKAHI